MRASACLAVAAAGASTIGCVPRVDHAEAEIAPPCGLGGPDPVGCGPDCLGNSSMVNSFPINGLHVKKCSNQQSVSLDPTIIWSPPRPACGGAELRVEGDRLTTDKGGTCGERNLVGSSFKVRKGGKAQVIKVAALQSFTYGGHVFHGYVFTGKDGVSLCNRDRARTFAIDLGMGADKTRPGERGGSKTAPGDQRSYDVADLALVFTGEVYDDHDRPIAASRTEYQGARWFNIACARDALAELDVYGIAPHGDPAQATDATSAKRTAGLKMMTASYCGDYRFASDGALIGWAAAVSAQPAGTVVEAYWTKTGATCLGRSRLVRNPPDRTVLPEIFNDDLRSTVTSMSLADGVVGLRDAVNHRCEPAARLADCAAGNAPAAYDFVTFVVAPAAGSPATVPHP